jgi:hypothetical protein
MADIVEPWGRNYVAELLEDGKVVVWPDTTMDDAAEGMEMFRCFNRHYFVVDLVLTPPVSVDGQESPS